MTRMFYQWSVLCFVLLALGCERGNEQKISVTGSSTVAPLIREIGARFEAQNPGVRVDVQMGGSSRGLSDARKGLADIGMMSRGLKDDESDVLEHAIARDGIAIIVNEKNPLDEVTKDQVAAIYTGEIKDWEKLTDRPGEVTVVNKAEGRSTLELFLKHFSIENPDIDADIIIGDNEQGIQTVARNPNAIGYVSVGTAEYNVSKKVGIKLVKMDGVTASRKTVQDGSFPISRPLILVTKGEPTGNAKRFIDFAKSDQVHDLIEGQYFVPMGP